MSQLEFEDQKSIKTLRREIIRDKSNPRIDLILKLHLARDEEGAKKVMLIVASIILVLSITLVIWDTYKANHKNKIGYNISERVLKRLPIDIQTNMLIN